VKTVPICLAFVLIASAVSVSSAVQQNSPGVAQCIILTTAVSVVRFCERGLTPLRGALLSSRTTRRVATLHAWLPSLQPFGLLHSFSYGWPRARGARDAPMKPASTMIVRT